MINLKKRFGNKAFWIAVIPACLLVIQCILATFGFDWDYTVINGNLIAIVNSIFALLTILGIVVDTSTPGITDAVAEISAPTSPDDAESLGEVYNIYNAEDTSNSAEPGNPIIENEEVLEVETENLIGNKIGK